jgi:hypothetical protein
MDREDERGAAKRLDLSELDAPVHGLAEGGGSRGARWAAICVYIREI